MGCDAVGWQGVTTLRAYAREEEQRGQRAAARLNRVRSALTQSVNVVVRQKFNVHAVYPAEESGQLPFLGLLHAREARLGPVIGPVHRGYAGLHGPRPNLVVQRDHQQLVAGAHERQIGKSVV